jgi:hypothetical protein
MLLAADFDLKPFGDGIDALGPDAMETTRDLVGALAEFAPGVEIGHHQLQGGHLVLDVHIDRNAAAVILNGDGTVAMEAHADVFAVPREGLVDGVVDNFKDTVMEAAFVGITDVHIGPFADPFQTLQFLDL